MDLCIDINLNIINHTYKLIKNRISIIKIHNRATHLNKCKIRNKNGTLLVNLSNSTVKNIFENGMMPKLIQ